MLENISYIPTSDDIFQDLYRKYIWNQEMCHRARNKEVFNIDGGEFVITEIKNCCITFTNIETLQDEVRYIEDLVGVKETGYELVL